MTLSANSVLLFLFLDPSHLLQLLFILPYRIDRWVDVLVLSSLQASDCCSSLTQPSNRGSERGRATFNSLPEDITHPIFGFISTWDEGDEVGNEWEEMKEARRRWLTERDWKTSHFVEREGPRGRSDRDGDMEMGGGVQKGEQESNVPSLSRLFRLNFVICISSRHQFL